MTNDKHWFVAYVRSCREKKAAEKLDALGYEYYLPVQRVVRQWSDRRKIVDRLVIPRVIFVRCSEIDRRRSLELVSDIYRYITTKGPYTASVVRDSEMEVFRYMVEKGNRSVYVTDASFAPGDRVRVISGPLEGLECELVSIAGKRCLAVHLGDFGTATMDLDIDTIKKITET